MAQYLLYKQRIGVNGCTKEEYASVGCRAGQDPGIFSLTEYTRCFIELYYINYFVKPRLKAGFFLVSRASDF